MGGKVGGQGGLFGGREKNGGERFLGWRTMIGGGGKEGESLNLGMVRSLAMMSVAWILGSTITPLTIDHDHTDPRTEANCVGRKLVRDPRVRVAQQSNTH